MKAIKEKLQIPEQAASDEKDGVSKAVEAMMKRSLQDDDNKESPKVVGQEILNITQSRKEQETRNTDDVARAPNGGQQETSNITQSSQTQEIPTTADTARGPEPELQATPPSVRPKSQKQEATSGGANLLTFSRQKLALIQCEYDPKRCNHCKTSAPVEELKTCSKCKTAKYCSRECQVADWEAKHKTHCKEIRRLSKIVQKEEICVSPVERVSFGAKLKAERRGKPWPLNWNMMYIKMTVCNDKLVLIGRSPEPGPNVVDVYSLHGKMEGRCRLENGEKGWSICTVEKDGSQYIGVSTFDTLMQSDRLEVWTYPFQKPLLLSGTRRHLGSCAEDPGMINEIYWYEGKFYASSDKERQIKELVWMFSPKVMMGPIWSPEGTLKVPTHSQNVTGLCVIKHGDDKAFVLLNKMTSGAEILRCLDKNGHELWRIKQQFVDDRWFMPSAVCCDQNGHIFVSDPHNNRVILINHDLGLHTLIVTPGKIACIAWYDAAQQLYVVHGNPGHLMMSVCAVSDA